MRDHGEESSDSAGSTLRLAARTDWTQATAAASLPPEAYDLTDYQPVREPVAFYRHYRRTAGPALGRPSTVPGPVSAATSSAWAEALHRDLAHARRPRGIVLAVRCTERHPLLWLIKSPWGPVPLTRNSDEPAEHDVTDCSAVTPLDAREGANTVLRWSGLPRSRRYVHLLHGEDLQPGRPRTLREWPDGRLLPPSSCQCYGGVELTVPQVRQWLAAAERDVTYRRPSRNV